LIAHRNALVRRLVADCELAFQVVGVFICRIDPKLALGAYDATRGHIRGIEAGREYRQSIAAKPQDRAGGFVDLLQPRCAAVDGQGHDF